MTIFRRKLAKLQENSSSFLIKEQRTNETKKMEELNEILNNLANFVAPISTTLAPEGN